jgi:hypothetical protein
MTPLIGSSPPLSSSSHPITAPVFSEAVAFLITGLLGTSIKNKIKVIGSVYF